MDTIGLWRVIADEPHRIETVSVDFERDLEGWIENDPGLLEQGLVIVSRQLRLEGGPLDLLALDQQGRWVLIEIKRERLRREVVAQAIDYASCLSSVDRDWLRERCDAYLREKSGHDTLDGLLSDRGQSLDAEADGRDIVIYLVGLGYDRGLERMVAFLAARAELQVRIVTFSAFHDAQGGRLLARKIHESVDSIGGYVQRAASRAPAPEALLALADQNGVGGVVRPLYEAAVRLGLYPHTWPRSIMIAPPANKSRCLYVIWVDAQRQPGVAKAWIAPEAFEQFYGITETDLKAAVGPVGGVLLDHDAVARLNSGLSQLLASHEVN